MTVYSAEKSEKTLFVGTVISVMLLAVSVFLFIAKREPDMPSSCLASCTVELVTMAYAVALLASVLFDHASITEETKWLVLMIFFLIVLLFCDCSSWIINYRQSFVLLNAFLYSATYLLGTLMSVLAWKLIRVSLRLKGKQFDLLERVIFGLFHLNIVLVLTNPLTNFLFRTDVETGVITYAVSEGIYLIQDGVILFINLVVVLSSPRKGEGKIAALVLVLTPLAGIVITYAVPEFECTYPISFVSVLFSFVCIYSGRTLELETKNKDISFAASIQQGMIPHMSVLGCGSSYEVCGSFLEAGPIGGDFYDYFMVNDHLLAFVVGDVCEEGIPAALCTMQTLSTVRDFASAGFRGEEVFTKTNRRLYETNRMGYFICCWLGFLDTETGDLSFVNAGHRPPLIAHPDGTVELLGTKPNLPLAAIETTSYTGHSAKLERGDTLVVCTDGVYESFRKTGNPDPVHTVTEAVSNGMTDISTFCGDIIAKADRDVPEGDEKEDMAVIAVRFNGLDDAEKEAES